MEKDSQCCNELAKLSAHDDEKFIELYETFFKRVYNFTYSKIRNASDADEITNEVFYKVFMNLEHYSGTGSFAAWLFRITLNAVNDYCRYKSRKRQVIAEDWEEFFNETTSEDEQPENLLLIEEERRLLLKALDKLTERERQIIALKYWSDCTNIEIAEILNLTASNVGIILFRALNKLKKIYGENADNE